MFSSYVAAVPDAGQMLTKMHNGGFTVPEAVTTPTGMGQLFAQLFALGIVGAATWQLGFTPYNFDTHADHYAQHPLNKALADIDTLIEAMKKIPLDAHTSVWERTTVVLASEFCRTPRLNSNAGKDHNVNTNAGGATWA